MFEIGVFAFILFAMGYWATLFIMGRREDVLHGQFVEAEPELVPAMAGVPTSLLRPVSPPPGKAASITAPAPAPVAVEAVPAAKSEPSVPAAAISSDAEAWESLFASIKLELKNAAQI
jgi:hypothetical protein